MTYTYLLLNTIFIALIIIVKRKIYRYINLSYLKTALLLVLLTIIFDNIMIYFEFFTYNSARILGIYIGKAPIEDLFYPIFAATIVPFIWESIEDNMKDKNDQSESKA